MKGREFQKALPPQDRENSANSWMDRGKRRELAGKKTNAKSKPLEFPRKEPSGPKTEKKGPESLLTPTKRENKTKEHQERRNKAGAKGSGSRQHNGMSAQRRGVAISRKDRGDCRGTKSKAFFSFC